jgi:hypothetical protein
VPLIAAATDARNAPDATSAVEALGVPLFSCAAGAYAKVIADDRIVISRVLRADHLYVLPAEQELVFNAAQLRAPSEFIALVRQAASFDRSTPRPCLPRSIGLQVGDRVSADFGCDLRNHANQRQW